MGEDTKFALAFILLFGVVVPVVGWICQSIAFSDPNHPIHKFRELCERDRKSRESDDPSSNLTPELSDEWRGGGDDET